MKKTNSKKGSALVFALVVMFIILTAALGVASVSVIDQRNSSTSGKSSQSFQVADSAVETVLKQAVTDPLGTTLGLLGSCANGVVTLSGLPGGSSAQVSFRDAFGNDIKNGVVIDGITYNNVCSTINLSQVAEVKAVATYGDTTRAISAAVAAGTLTWIDLPLTSNWENSGTLGNPAKYAKDARTGIVYLKGYIKLRSTTSYIPTNSWTFTPSISNAIPSDCRPPKNEYIAAACAGGGAGLVPCFVNISSDGIIGITAPSISGTTNNIAVLDGISFSTN